MSILWILTDTRQNNLPSNSPVGKNIIMCLMHMNELPRCHNYLWET